MSTHVNTVIMSQSGLYEFETPGWEAKRTHAKPQRKSEGVCSDLDREQTNKQAARSAHPANKQAD